MSISNKRPSIPKQNVTSKTSMLGPDPYSVKDYLYHLKPRSIKQLIISQNLDSILRGLPNKSTEPFPPYLGYVDIEYVLVDYVENTL
jgi:hypothetical protein